MNTPSPDRDTLLNFLHGKLSDAESEQIAQLVENDPDLQDQLEELDRSDDTFIEMLRQNHEDTPTEGYTDYEVALEQAKNIFHRDLRKTLGEYELLERIGQGGMGVVFKARHMKLGRTVAIKVIADARATDEKAIARFEREIKTIGQLEHPSIVHAHDAREIDGRSILVMEYVDGMDLGRLIRRHGPISMADACELIRQTMLGLQAAHELGLVHRDIKPSNLMLDRQGNLKILDLGLARQATDLKEWQREISMSFDVTQTGQAMGTADYMAPEQADHPDLVDIRADIYSAGCTLFKLLTGRAPYHEEMTFDKLSAHAEMPLPPTPDLPDALRAILDRMTAKNPDDRFSTPDEVAHALEPFCANHNLIALLTLAESQTTPAHTLPRPAAGGRFRRIVTLLLLLAFSGSLGLFGGILLTINRNGKETQLEIPDGAQASIDKQGNVTVDLTPKPSETGSLTTQNQSNEDPLKTYVNDRNLLKGKWRLVAATGEGKPLPVLAQNFCKLELVFEGDYIKYIEDGEELEKIPFIIDTTTTPKRISWPHGIEDYSIYKIEGNLLTVCVRDPKQKGHPDSFTKGPAQGIFVWAKTTNTIPVYWNIGHLLSPIKLRASAFLSGNLGSERGVTLDITSKPDQTKRWAGKTLRVTWPKGFEVDASTITQNGITRNLEKRWIQWTISEETLANNEPAYQIKFQALPETQGTFKFYASLLDSKTQRKWNTASCNLQMGLPQKVESVEKNEEDRQNLFGLWECVSAKIGGQTVTVRDLTNLKIAINNTYIYHPTSWERQGSGWGSAGTKLVIDATTNPKRMSFPYDPSYGHDQRLNSYSIYQLEDDRLTISFPLHPYPTQFASESNSTNVSIVFERVKGPLPDLIPIANRTTYKLLFPNLFPDERTPPIPSLYTQPPTSVGPTYTTIDPTILEPSLLNENEKELQQLIGTWKVVSIKDSGEESLWGGDVKLAIGPEDLEWTGRLVGDDMKGKKPYTIDATTTPKRISWPSGMEQYSIYKIEDDRLWICLAENEKSGHPTKFVSEKDSPNDVLIVLERDTNPLRSKTEGYLTPEEHQKALIEAGLAPKVLPAQEPKHAGASPAANDANRDVQLPGVWKLVERPNRDGCLIFTGEKENTPEVTVTFTDDKLYLRGDEIVSRQFDYEVSPDKKNINLLDGRNQVYRGIMNFEQDGKRLILVCGQKERPAGTWEYFGTNYERLVLEKTEVKPNVEAISFDKSLLKKWFLMSTNPPPSASGIPSTPLDSLARRFTVVDTPDSLYYTASATFSKNGYLVLDKSPAFSLSKAQWPKRFACDVDPSAKPKRFDVAMDDKTIFKGIYKTEGNRLFIRFAPKDKARPKDFECPVNNDLVELEFASSTAPTPELATVLFTRDGATVFDDRYTNPPPFQPATSAVALQLKKYPNAKVVLDSSHQTSDLIYWRRSLLDADVKSVHIKTGSRPSSFPSNVFSWQLKYLPKIYDIPFSETEILPQQLPTPCNIKRELLGFGGLMHHHSGAPILQNAPNDPLSQIPLWFQKLEDEPNIIRAKLDPKIVEQIQMVSSQENGSRRDHLGPEEKVAIVINNNLIIAVTTLGTLQKGSFDINYKLNDEERKIFINTLKEAKKSQSDGFGGGGMMGP